MHRLDACDWFAPRHIGPSLEERDAMLEKVGVKSLDALFDAVPAKYRFPKLDLPPALTEMEAADELSGLAQANENVRSDLISFLGAGMYNHYIPSVVDHMLRRGDCRLRFCWMPSGLPPGSRNSLAGIRWACGRFRFLIPVLIPIF